MNDVNREQWHRIIVHGTVAGFVGIFFVVFGICLVDGLSPIESAGVAIIPAIQACWFYGGTAYLLRAAYGEEQGQKSKGTKADLALPSRDYAQKAA
jgi:hypothetical protein